jgi:hypothetical protein
MRVRNLVIGVVMAGAAIVTRPASACLNDRQVIAAENEFKSSYLAKKEEKPGRLWRVSVGGWLAVGLGVAMLGTTAVISLRSGGRRE